MKICLRCGDARWVCEAHPDKPWRGAHGCSCGAPGKPCPICNKSDPAGVPDMPADIEVEALANLDALAIEQDCEEVRAALNRLIASVRRKH